ncbi:MAG TPA: glycine cleavage system protein GcvH [Methylophilaceae bacterium]|jgi:glycine cleavage system H protein
MKINPDLFYTEQHLWVKPVDGGQWLAGITDYAQDLLGDIVFVEAPKIGSDIVFGDPCGLVESVKTGSDLHAPITGKVTEINPAVLDTPELINDKPYDAWIFKVSAEEAPNTLMGASEYQDFLNKS